MGRRRLRGDLGNLTSWVLLAAATASIVTGVVAHAWDLNGFTLHTTSGYVMTAAALVHVALSWRRLVAYSSMRVRHLRSWLARRAGTGAARRPATGRGAVPAGGTSRPAQRPRRDGRGGGGAPAVAGPEGRSLTRRGLLGAGLTGALGVVAGRGLRPPPPIEAGSDLGLVYHEWSKPGVIDALGTLTDWGGRPPAYKSVPGAGAVPLPAPVVGGGPALREVVADRHSTREYAGGMSAATLSSLLALTGGVRPGEDRRRTYPSSGALFPLELYPVVNDVEGVAPGVYHYDVRGHGLTPVRPGDASEAIMHGGLDQDFLASADVVLVVTMIVQRMRFKYRDRSYRYGLLEAGHVGQNLYLAASSLGLGACAVGAFRDDEVNDLVDVDGREEFAVYLLAAGTPAGAA